MCSPPVGAHVLPWGVINKISVPAHARGQRYKYEKASTVRRVPSWRTHIQEGGTSWRTDIHDPY